MTPLKFMFVGDTHGDLNRMFDIIEKAHELGCYEIIQVGDWGYLWPGAVDEEYNLREMTECLRKHNLSMRFCDGNHDWHPLLRKAKPGVLNNIAQFITYQHRGSLVRYIDGTNMVFFGGAPSIDRGWRTKNVNWWEEEYITDEDSAEMRKHANEKVHVLVTHDSATPPPGIKETEDVGFNYRAHDSQLRITEAIHLLKPEVHVHGHYHHRYSREFESTKVEGLASNLGLLENMFYVYERSGS